MMKLLIVFLLVSVTTLRAEKLVNEMLELYSDYLKSHDAQENSNDVADLEYGNDVMGDPADDVCKIGGKSYKSGERFMTGCKQCKCNGGSFSCLHACSPSMIMCKPGEKKITVQVKVSKGCSCPRPKCVPDVCKIGGKTYKSGESFSMKCNPCRCNGGSFSCVSACSPSMIMCKPGEKKITVQVKVSKGCSCPRPKCVPDKSKDEEIYDQVYGENMMEDPASGDCKMPDGKVYKSGLAFINEDCNRCRCRRGALSCVSGCPPVRIMCSSGQKKVMTKQKLNDKCSCSVPKCV